MANIYRPTYNISVITGEELPTNPQVKISDTFTSKPVKVKISGTFQEKPMKVKVDGEWQ